MISLKHEHPFLSETYVEHITLHIGEFWNPLSKKRPSYFNNEFIILQKPIVYGEHAKKTLINSSNNSLKTKLKIINENIKIQALQIVKTNLTITEIQDFFRLDSLSELYGKILYEKIIEEITSENTVLEKLCPDKNRQLGYINRNFCIEKIGPQKLGNMNREIDIKLTLKYLHDMDIKNIEIDALEKTSKIIKTFDSKKFNSNKIKKPNNKSFLLYFVIEISSYLKISDINDLYSIAYYLKTKNFLEKDNLLILNTLTSSIKNKLGFKPDLKKLMNIIKEIENTKSKSIDNYNFFRNELMGDNEKMDKIIEYISKKILEMEP